MKCGQNDPNAKKYRLDCDGICGGGEGDEDSPFNCIDHIRVCKECQRSATLHENDEEYACVRCRNYCDEMVYSMYRNETEHLSSGFGLCQKCYRELLGFLDKESKDSMKSAIEDFIKKVKYVK